MLRFGRSPRRPLRVALLCSGRGPGIDHLLTGDQPRVRRYDIVGAVTSDPDCVERPRLRAAGVPVEVHDLRGFCRARQASPADMDVRPDYDRDLAQRLGRFEPDLVMLSGYLYVLTAPMLDAFPNLVSLHDSDLTRIGPDGLPAYRGLHSTRDAVFAGEPATRSTLHLVTQAVDLGPPLVRSWSFPVSPMVPEARAWGAGANHIIKAYAYAQREWMMRAAWGPMLARAIDLFARGEVSRLDGRANVAGRPGPVDLDPPGATGASNIARLARA